MRARSRPPVHWLAGALLIVAVAALPAVAADGPKSDAAKAEAKIAKAEQDAMMAEVRERANLGPMHALLDPLAGKWRSVSQSWVGTEPAATAGTCERTWLMGGRFLQSKHKGTFDKMPFEGMELLGYDTKRGEYSSVWIDNMGTMLSLRSRGRVNPTGKVLTMYTSFNDPVTGKTVPARMITKIIDNNSHTFTMIGTSNGKDYTEMEITYTRVK